MSFRPATIDDAEFFWQQRHQAEQHPWYEGQPTSRDNHWWWFKHQLVCDRPLLVWEDCGKKLGTLRIESNGEVTISAESDAMGKLLEAVKGYATEYGNRLKCIVDDGDPRADALKAAGFTESPVRFFTYRP